MTSSDTLKALADRCEAASGPDRELDGEIAEALGLRSVPRTDRYYVSLGGGERVLVTWRIGRVAIETFVGEAPAFTESCEAAMMLVPEGFAFGVGRGTNDAEVEGWAWCGPDEGPYVFAATPALALTAAALRARAVASQEVL